VSFCLIKTKPVHENHVGIEPGKKLPIGSGSGAYDCRSQGKKSSHCGDNDQQKPCKPTASTETFQNLHLLHITLAFAHHAVRDDVGKREGGGRRRSGNALVQNNGSQNTGWIAAQPRPGPAIPSPRLLQFLTVATHYD
jgi:hypothetical protein